MAFLCSTAQDLDPWAGFDADSWGLTQVEMSLVKESSLTPQKTIQLLSIGIRPKEYLERPWRALGISEGAWLEGRDLGYGDDDLDQAKPPLIPTSAWKNLMLPGLGDHSNGHALRAGLFSASALGLWAGAFLLADRHDRDAGMLMGMACGVHLISFSFGFQKDPRLLGGRRTKVLPRELP